MGLNKTIRPANIAITITTFAITACTLLLTYSNVEAQHTSFKTDKKFTKQINQTFKLADRQYQLLSAGLPPHTFPKTYQNGKLETSASGWWCSGFYPGTMLYIYRQTHDTKLLDEANKALKNLEAEQYNKTTHDLGFMMYCSFGNAQKLKPQHAYKQILINSAKSLASRFDPKVGCIRSWDSKPNEYLVIIDNMMNLELLFWATKATGDSSYYKIAVTHANTTIKNHFRPDYSSYHVINYSSANGHVLQKRTAQGFSNESAWARGQAWGLYGYTVMYRETHDVKYLQQAKNIAHFILTNPNLPADKIPYWDFNAPNIPNALRDASAAAIMASAFLELCRYTDKSSAQRYYKTAETMLKNLSQPPYLATPATNGGFILQHSVGHMPNKTEIDVPLTYADYYFVEALNRYLNINKHF